MPDPRISARELAIVVKGFGEESQENGKINTLIPLRLTQKWYKACYTNGVITIEVMKRLLRVLLIKWLVISNKMMVKYSTTVLVIVILLEDISVRSID